MVERPRPQLAAVADAEDEAPPAQHEAPREPPEGPKRAHLRLVR
jgi:hypothetical protein